MNKKIKKVIIPAAGWGTRFLPWTKIFHKELLPIMNKPLIHYLIDEINETDIEEIILIISSRKKEISKYFRKNKKLELFLENKESKILEKIDLKNECKIRFINQKRQLGLGHAIQKAAKFIHNEPFAVILADDLVNSRIPAIKQLIDVYDKKNRTIIGVQEVPSSKVKKYGIVNYDMTKNKDKTTFKIKSAIEKPNIDEAPSNIAILGRYIFTPLVMDLLKEAKINKNKELDIIDIFDTLIKKESIYAHKFKGQRYDLGSVEGFIKANIDYGMNDKVIGKEIKNYIKSKK